MIQYSQIIKKCKYPPHAVHYFYVHYYQQKKILCTRISFRVKKKDIENQYDLYSIKCIDGSSILEGVDFTVSYAPVTGIIYIRIIIPIASAEGFIFSLKYQTPSKIIFYPILKKWFVLFYHIYTWNGSK